MNSLRNYRQVPSNHAHKGLDYCHRTGGDGFERRRLVIAKRPVVQRLVRVVRRCNTIGSTKLCGGARAPVRSDAIERELGDRSFMNPVGNYRQLPSNHAHKGLDYCHHTRGDGLSNAIDYIIAKPPVVQRLVRVVRRSGAVCSDVTGEGAITPVRSAAVQREPGDRSFMNPVGSYRQVPSNHAHKGLDYCHHSMEGEWRWAWNWIRGLVRLEVAMPDITRLAPPSKARNQPLPLEIYSRIGTTVLFTVRALRGAPFQHAGLNGQLIDLLGSMRIEHRCWVGAYCLMPDHLHFVTGPREEGACVINFTERFKGKSTNTSWKHGCNGRLWQPRFHDHVLRGAEAMEDITAYVLQNPVQAGLCERPEDWPWSGILDTQEDLR